MVSSLAQKFIKSSQLLSSKYEKDEIEDVYYDTNIPVLNLAFSSYLDRGPSYGISCFAGKSKSLKSVLGLLVCQSYLAADPDMFMIYYDSEGGASKAYFESVGIDPSRVIYIPIMNVEELKFDITEKLETIHKDCQESGEKPKFVWFIDSIGNLASNKEVDDALDKKSVADMTRAKAMKSLTRIITPYFMKYKMELIAIQHTYDEIGGMGAPKQIMSGGTGWMLSANDVFLMGKRQIKEDGKIIGWQFILNVEKSRTIREKSAIPLDVTYNEWIDEYSGLLDIALITGHVTKPKMGWYTRPSIENDKNWRKKETSSDDFWNPLLSDESFKNAVHDLYALEGKNVELQKALDDTLSMDSEEQTEESVTTD